MSRSKLGKRYRCFQCACAFFDLGKGNPICPRCNSDQRKAPKKATFSRARSSSKRSEIRYLPGMDLGNESEAEGLEAMEFDDCELKDQSAVAVVEEE